MFALAGVLALVGMPSQPGGAGALLLIAVADLTVAGVAWLLPWSRWPRHAPLALAVPAFVVLGFSTWAFGGMATGTGPFFVLVFAWIGLHFAPSAAVIMGIPGAVAYVVPLVVTGQPPEVLSSAVILLPVAVAVALLIAAQAGHLRRERERIARVERWRAGLAATLAHDLRSPLATVQLVLEEVRSDSEVSAERRDQLVEIAVRHIARITRLTSGLLDLDRIETHGQLRLDLAPVAVRAAAEQAAGLLNVAVRLEIEPVGLEMLADPERLEQILVNLIGNAMRHGQPPIVVGAERAGDHVRVTVRDHGPGVPDEARNRLFTRFGGASAHTDHVHVSML